MTNSPTLNDDPLIGRQLANFRIDHVIRRGGMAQVYYGWDVKLNRVVAIKVIDARYRSKPSYAERFVREAQAVATWRHPNIVQVFYADDQDELYYYVMEHVDGLDLAQLMNSYTNDGELIPFDDVIRLGRAIASALDYAHRKGVVHRDVKPSNVMVATDGRVLLTDFGLAMAIDDESQGEIFGTPHYVAPEQAHRSADAVPQSDLYSLGVILYEMLVGTVPFDDQSPTSIALQHITEEPPEPRQINPNLNMETEAVLLKALSKLPQDRYQTGEALINALETALQSTPAELDSPLDLPPLPAGIQSQSASTASRLSRLSVVERIAIELGNNEKPLPVSRRRGIPLWYFGAAILLITLFLIAITPRLNAILTVEPTPTATTTELIVAVATNEPTTTNTPIPPTDTPTPTTTATAVPSSPTITNTVTTIPSTSTPNPTSTSTITPTPAGDQLLLFYDNNSFYIWNPTNKRLTLTNLAFEAIDTTDASTGIGFLARQWVAVYDRLEVNACYALEIASATNFLEPFQCDEYNARLQAFRGSDTVFWVRRADVEFFRVYWEGETIADCPILAGSCNIYVPTD